MNQDTKLTKTLVKVLLSSFISLPAAAITHHSVDFTNQVLENTDWWTCQCFRGPQTYAWAGNLSFDTSDGRDGAFAVQSSNLDLGSISPGPWHLAFPGTATLVGGEVTGLNLEFDDYFGDHAAFSGSTTFALIENVHHWNRYRVEGNLVSPVPEPGTWILLFAGLGMFALRKKEN